MKNNKHGFSLMEMMVVMLIAAIVAAASAPMVSKKLIKSTGNSSPWDWIAAGIRYNGGPNDTAVIGNGNRDIGGNPRLYVRTDANTTNTHIAFRHGNEVPTSLVVRNSSILFSNGDQRFNTPPRAVSYGLNSNVSESSVAIGFNAVANGDSRSVAIGSRAFRNNGMQDAASASGECAIAIGTESQANRTNTTAVGDNARATGDINGNTEIHTGATAIGAGARAHGDAAIAIGLSAQAHGNGANNTITATEGSIAIGASASASGSSRSIAIGSVAHRFNGMQDAASASGECAIAIGTESQANRTNTTAVGDNARATGDINGNTEIHTGATAIGANTRAHGNNAMAIGPSAQAHGNGANNTITAANDAIAIGPSAQATATNSIAIGSGVTSNVANRIVLGNANSTVYIPGNLVVDQNAILSRSSGHVYASMGIAFMGTSRVRQLKSQSIDTFGVSGLNVVSHDSVGNDFSVAGFTISDRRLKNVGKAFTGGLEQIKKLEVFNYTFKKDETKTPRVGIMAQDLQKIFPNAVFKGDDGFLRIRTEDMFYAMVNAIKELDAKINLLVQKQKKIDELEKRVDKLEKRLAELEKKVK